MPIGDKLARVSGDHLLETNQLRIPGAAPGFGASPIVRTHHPFELPENWWNDTALMDQAEHDGVFATTADFYCF